MLYLVSSSTVVRELLPFVYVPICSRTNTPRLWFAICALLDDRAMMPSLSLTSLLAHMCSAMRPASYPLLSLPLGHR